MSKQTHIFATKADLIPNLTVIESQRPLKYVLYDTYYSSNIPAYLSLLNYKRLGVNSGRDHNSGDLFFVMDRDAVLDLERTRIFFGIAKYSFNQSTIPDSITFQPGGLFKDKYLICGHIGTVSDADISIELFNQFSQAVT